MAPSDPPSGADGSELPGEQMQGDRGADANLRDLLEDYERRLILLALEAAGGHQRRAAQSLGLQPSTLSQKMKRLGVRRTVQVAWQAGESPETDL